MTCVAFSGAQYTLFSLDSGEVCLGPFGIVLVLLAGMERREKNCFLLFDGNTMEWIGDEMGSDEMR